MLDGLSTPLFDYIRLSKWFYSNKIAHIDTKNTYSYTRKMLHLSQVHYSNIKKMATNKKIILLDIVWYIYVRIVVFIHCSTNHDMVEYEISIHTFIYMNHNAVRTSMIRYEVKAWTSLATFPHNLYFIDKTTNR